MIERSWRELLPWSEPFLMIDGLEDCVRGESIVTRKCVTSGDPCVGGSDGGPAALPSMLLLEAMGQSAALLFRMSYPETAVRALPLLGFLKAELRGTASAGDAVRFEVRSIKMTRSGGVFEARATLGSALLAEAELAFKAGDDAGRGDA